MKRQMLAWFQRLFPVLAGLVMIVALGCGALSGGQLNSPKKVPSTAQASAAVTLQALDVVQQAGHLATAVRDFERDLTARGVLTPAQHDAFNKAFAKTQAAADKAIDQLQSGQATFAVASKSIVDTLNDLVVQGQAGLKVLVDSIRLLLTLKPAVPVPVQ